MGESKFMAAAREGLRRHPWLQSLGVTAAAVAVALWLWFGPWISPSIPWLVVGPLPFLIGLFAPKLPLLLALLPVTIPYLLEGSVKAPLLLGGWGASYIVAAFGILLRRLFVGNGGAAR
jgi:hypothetical protein